MTTSAPDVRMKRLRRTWTRLLIGGACLMMLTCGGGAWWWVSRPDFGDDVREAGGRYRREVMETWMSALSNMTNGRPNTVFHAIEFAPGTVDDTWLEQNQAQIRELSFLSISLRETQVTELGLSHLDGAENLNALSLRGTQLTDAAINRILDLPHLSSLDIAGTGIPGAAVADLAHMPNLGHITLDSSQLTAEAMTGLKQCSRLGSVVLVDANDDSVEQVTQLNGLVGLELFGDDVTAASFPALKQLQGLQVLTFWSSDFSDDELAELRYALPGCVVQQLDSELLDHKREAAWE